MPSSTSPLIGRTTSRRAEPPGLAKLLRRSLKLGVAVLGTQAKAAIARLLTMPPAERQQAWAEGRLFNDAERVALANALSAVTATAELAGRVKVRSKADGRA